MSTKFALTIIVSITLLALTSHAQTKGKTHIQHPTSSENNGGGWITTWKGATGGMYSYTALDQDGTQICSNAYTVNESLSWAVVVATAGYTPGGASHTGITDSGPIMDSENVCLPTNGTFIDFIYPGDPVEYCKSYEKSLHTTLKDGTAMSVVDTCTGHSYILHDTSKATAIYPLTGSYTQQVAYMFKKVSGSWTLDTSYTSNPVIMQ